MFKNVHSVKIMKKILVCFFLLTSLFILTMPGQAAETLPRGDFAELRETGIAKVTQVIDPQTLQLDDGQIIALAGLDFPDLVVKEPGELALLAAQILRDMLEGKEVRIYQTQGKDWGRSNRMGHQIAHIARKSDGAWVQGVLLDLGLARVMTGSRNPEMAAQMYALEQSAREAKIGLWDGKAYKILSPIEAADAIESFQIVEGKIESVSLNKNRVYLNFGKNWRDDFTVSVAPGDKRLFTKAGIDLMMLGGKTVRARGWVRSYNGPYMEIDHPQALEFVGEKNSEPDPLPDASESPMLRTIDNN